MSVVGFSEAYENTLIVRLRTEPALDVKVTSLPGLVVLKLISWKDRSSGKDRDALDLAHIIKNYYRADNEDRLYNENYNIMEELDHRIEEAGARLLGQDIASMIKPKTKDLILRILDEETAENGQYKLLSTIVRVLRCEDFDKILALMKELYKGISENA